MGDWRFWLNTLREDPMPVNGPRVLPTGLSRPVEKGLLKVFAAVFPPSLGATKLVNWV